MNNLINMSDHEKIIFVNGMSENQNANITDIKELSNNYPFVVFFTNSKFLKYDENPYKQEESPYPIANIWKNGIRLTRFIGVDPGNDLIDLGNGHKLKLTFDYETGLIGLYEYNKLLKITLKSISYIDLNGYEQLINADSATINAKDNKFSFVVEFTVSGEVDSILNSLSINNDSENFTILGSSKYNGMQSTESIAYYKYDCKINKDTFKNTSGITYNISSVYSPSISLDYPKLKLNLILNPTSYKVTYSNEYNGTLTELVTSQNNTITIPYESEYDLFTVYLNPTEVESYKSNNGNIRNTRKLYVKLTKDNNYIKFAGNDDALYQIQEITGASVSFRIKPNNASNQTVKTILTFSILYDLNDGNGMQTYNYLTENRVLYLEGNTKDTYYYAGYDNPSDNNFDINKLVLFDDTEIGTSVIWDWKNSNLSNIDNAPFYIAIPSNYFNIKPRWDAYTYDRNGNRKYVECGAFWFEVSAKIINGINFTIYKKLKNGLFYGKIQ